MSPLLLPAAAGALALVTGLAALAEDLPEARVAPVAVSHVQLRSVTIPIPQRGSN